MLKDAGGARARGTVVMAGQDGYALAPICLSWIPMARITVEDCLDHVDNRFELVMKAARRARQLAGGRPSLVPEENDKPTVVALREIAEGLITVEVLDREDIEQQKQKEPVELAFRGPLTLDDGFDDL